MKAKFKQIISMALIVATLAGCSTFMQKEKVELNQRQIEILEKEGKPTKWSKLQSYEKQSIQTIEEMLEYLENKYNKEFCYAYFKMADFITGESDSLLAYAKGDNPETDLFEVYIKDGQFADDYGKILAHDGFYKKLEDALSGLLDADEYKMIVNIGSVDENNNVLGSDVKLFIVDHTEDELFAKEIEKSIYKVEGVGRLRIIYVKKEYFDVLTEDNWEDKYDEDMIIAQYITTWNTWDD